MPFEFRRKTVPVTLERRSGVPAATFHCPYLTCEERCDYDDAAQEFHANSEKYSQRDVMRHFAKLVCMLVRGWELTDMDGEAVPYADDAITLTKALEPDELIELLRLCRAATMLTEDDRKNLSRRSELPPDVSANGVATASAENES